MGVSISVLKNFLIWFRSVGITTMWSCWSLLGRGRVFGVVRMRMIVLLIWVSLFFFRLFVLKQRGELNILISLDQRYGGMPERYSGELL